MFLFGELPESSPAVVLEGVNPVVATSMADLFSVARAANEFLHHLEHVITRHPLSQAQFRLLMVLTYQLPDGATTSAVATALGVKGPTLTQLVDNSRHLVNRARRAPDRRVAWLSPTLAGEQLLSEVLPDIGDLAVGLGSALGSNMDQLHRNLGEAIRGVSQTTIGAT